MASILGLPRDLIKMIIARLPACSRVSFVQSCSYIFSSSIPTDRFMWSLGEPLDRRSRLEDVVDEVNALASSRMKKLRFTLDYSSYCKTCALPMGKLHSRNEHCPYTRSMRCPFCKEVGMVCNLSPWTVIRKHSDKSELMKRFGFHCGSCDELMDNLVGQKCLLCNNFVCAECKAMTCEVCKTKIVRKRGEPDTHLCTDRWLPYFVSEMKRTTPTLPRFVGKGYVALQWKCTRSGPGCQDDLLIQEVWTTLKEGHTLESLLVSLVSFYGKPHVCSQPDDPFLFVVDEKNVPDSTKSLYDQATYKLTMGEFCEMRDRAKAAIAAPAVPIVQNN